MAKIKTRRTRNNVNYGKKTLMGLIGQAVTMGHGQLSNFSVLETGVNNILIGKDGSAASVIAFRGSKKMIGVAELEGVVNSLSGAMSTMMGNSGHSLQIYFSRNPDDSRLLVEDILSPGRAVADSLNMDLSDLFAEDSQFMPKWIAKEDIYFVLWTKPSILSKEERANAEVNEEQEALENPWRSLVLPEALDMQNPHRAGRVVVQRHRSMVGSFLTALSQESFNIELLNVHDALRAVHDSIYPGLSEGAWSAKLPSDNQTYGANKSLTKWTRESARDSISALMWPRIDEQLFTEDAEIINNEVCRIGKNYFGTIDIATPMQDLESFRNLLVRTLNQDDGRVPWRMSVYIDGAGLSKFNLRKTLASVLAFTTPGGYNANIRDAITNLSLLQKNGEKIVRVRVAFSTWSPVSSGLRIMEERILSMTRNVEAWGNCQVFSISGDPVASAMGTTMGLGTACTAPAFGAPLSDVLYILPWMRDVSPWKNGSCMFRTEDRRPFPVELGSSLQLTFNELISGQPGSGKSFWLATTNMGACLSPRATTGIGGADLPMIRVVDIGPSQQGFCSIITDSLPENERHKVLFRKMRMTPEFAINPFDTPLGSRMPTRLDEQFLVSFLSICVANSKGELPPKMGDMISLIVHEVYKKFSDKERRNSSPREYQAGHAEIDNALKEINFKPKFWWDVVDEFYRRKMITLAYVAQRYAVPRMEDLISFSSESIEGAYRGVMDTSISQSIIESFQLSVEALVRRYQILAYPTAFDIGNARIAVLDIQGIIGGSGPEGEHQTSIMYMLARAKVASEFYGNVDIIDEFNPDYREFHLQRLGRIYETPKKLVFDEFHRTGSSPLIQSQIERDMREGRKFNIQIALASQSLADFADIFFQLASGVWIMSADEQDKRVAAEKLNLSKTALASMNRLTGARKDGSGSPFLAVLKMRDGNHEHFLMNTLGPQRIWAFSTTAEDSSLRYRLYNKMPASEARNTLAIRFPGGSAKSEIEARAARRATESSHKLDKLALDSGIIDEFVEEVYNMWIRMKASEFDSRMQKK